jgi:hypothetical protein
MHVPFKDLSPESFRLGPQLKERLAGLKGSLCEGLGFGLIRGLDAKRSVEESIIIHAGLSSYFGTKRGYMGSKGNEVLGLSFDFAHKRTPYRS